MNFSYNNAWYPSTDGLGFSLVIRNDDAAASSWNLKASWRPSGEASGNPGAADTDPGIAAVLVNEVVSHGANPASDNAIELYNSTGNAVDASGWYLTDDKTIPQKFAIPSGTVIPSNGYWSFNADAVLVRVQLRFERR